MKNIQAEILAPIPKSARYLTFDLSSTENIDNKLIELGHFTAKHSMVTAFGKSLDALYKFSKSVTGSYFWCPL